MKNCFYKKSMNKNKLSFTNINCLRTSWEPIKKKKLPPQNTTYLRIGQQIIRRIQWLNATELEQENLDLARAHLHNTVREKPYKARKLDSVTHRNLQKSLDYEKKNTS